MEHPPTEPQDDEAPEVGMRGGRKPSFWAALAAYAVLAILVGVTLNGPTIFEFRLRVVVWLLLAALAVKTFIHRMRDS